MITTISDLSTKLDVLRNSGVQRGELTGFYNLDALYSIKQGSFTIVLGAPAHGKSEFCFELLLNQTEKYGKKHLIYSPETGSSDEIAMELIHKYLGKTAYKTNKLFCTDKDFEAAKNYIDAHFFILSDENQSFTIHEIFEMVLMFEKQKGIKIDCLMTEPYNELRHEIKDGRQDLYIEEVLTDIRRFTKKHNKHLFLTMHPSHQHQVKDNTTGVMYYPMPKAREAAGGQASLRKAMSWINIWRPFDGMIDMVTNMPYDKNTLIVTIEKSKPKGVGERGTCLMYFDWQKNRYYEKLNNLPSFAFEHAKNTSTYYQLPDLNLTGEAPF
jgi:hypothetical protein